MHIILKNIAALYIVQPQHPLPEVLHIVPSGKEDIQEPTGESPIYTAILQAPAKQPGSFPSVGRSQYISMGKSLRLRKALLFKAIQLNFISYSNSNTKLFYKVVLQES